MKRILTALRWELTLQYRYGFYAVSLIVVLVYTGLLGWLRDAAVDLALLVPAALVMNLLMTTFYFVSALVLLEKDEGILAALSVSPLRRSEYIGVKVLSLSGLALVENGAILALVLGDRPGLGPALWLGLPLGAFYTLVGLGVVVGYQGISEFLLPSIVVVTFLLAPLIDHFSLWPAAWWWLHPVQPFLVLLRAPLLPPTPGSWLLAPAAALFWLLLAYVWAARRFDRLAARPVQAPGASVPG